jgi:hypothetical protein
LFKRKRFLKEEFQSFLDQLKGTFANLGQAFGETFKQVGEVAAQQGAQLLQQTLQQGAQLAAQGAQSKIICIPLIMQNTVFGEYINDCIVFVKYIASTSIPIYHDYFST